MTPELCHIKDLLADFDRPWYVAGGWALDLCLGRITRQHSDIDIAILRADQATLRSTFEDWQFQFTEDGKRVNCSQELRLVPPNHEIHALSPDRHTVLEFLLNESTENRWLYRRNSTVTLPLNKMGSKTAVAIPFLNPAIVLLYKSKQPIAKDHDDFDAALERLEQSARGWLKAALQRCNPQHPWIGRL